MRHDPETLEMLRRQLLERRSALITSTLRGQEELISLKDQPKSAEMEEDAQTSAAEFVLTKLGESKRREVAKIDAALARIEAGTYGECIDCGARISVERLMAVPYALRDAGCTAQYEAREHALREYPSL